MPDSIEIKITYNLDTQGTSVTVDKTKVKTFDFLLAIMDMAKKEVERQEKMAQMQQMIQAQAQAQQEAAISRQIFKGR